MTGSWMIAKGVSPVTSAGAPSTADWVTSGSPRSVTRRTSRAKAGLRSLVSVIGAPSGWRKSLIATLAHRPTIGYMLVLPLKPPGHAKGSR
ncbi:hypothetical protein D3C87_1656750 [compost metagenome]